MGFWPPQSSTFIQNRVPPFLVSSRPLFHKRPKARPGYQRDTKAWCSKLELSVKPGNRSKEGMLVENEVQKVLEGRWSSHSKVPLLPLALGEGTPLPFQMRMTEI